MASMSAMLIESPFKNPPFALKPLVAPPRDFANNAVLRFPEPGSLRSSGELGGLSPLKFARCGEANPFQRLLVEVCSLSGSLSGKCLAVLSGDGKEEPGCVQFGDWYRLVEKAAARAIKKSKSGLGKARNILSRASRALWKTGDSDCAYGR